MATVLTPRRLTLTNLWGWSTKCNEHGNLNYTSKQYKRNNGVPHDRQEWVILCPNHQQLTTSVWRNLATPWTMTQQQPIQQCILPSQQNQGPSVNHFFLNEMPINRLTILGSLIERSKQKTNIWYKNSIHIGKTSVNNI